KGFGDSMDDLTNDVEVDAAGNMYLIGEFVGRLDFGGNNRLISAGGRDCFIISFTSGGVYRWSQRIGGATNDGCRKSGIDTAGNVYVFGDYTGTADFGDGSFTSAGGTDAFVASYTSAGAHRFTHRIAGTGYEWIYG